MMKAKALKRFLEELTPEQLEYEICFLDETTNKPYYTHGWDKPFVGIDDKTKTLDLSIAVEDDILQEIIKESEER